MLNKHKSTIEYAYLNVLQRSFLPNKQISFSCLSLTKKKKEIFFSLSQFDEMICSKKIVIDLLNEVDLEVLIVFHIVPY